jgi:hypothetical protein
MRGHRIRLRNRSPHTTSDLLKALRGPGESYSDVILRVAAEG